MNTWKQINKRLKEPFFKFDYDDQETWKKRVCLAIYTVMGIAGWAVLYGIYLLVT